MRKLTFTVPEAYDAAQLKGFLRHFCGVSARLLTDLKKEPLGITVNGVHATVRKVLQAGDQVQLALPADGACPEPVDLPLAPLYEDRDLLAVDKPAAMPVHPSPGHDRDSLANAAAAYFQKKMHAAPSGRSTGWIGIPPAYWFWRRTPMQQRAWRMGSKKSIWQYAKVS